MTVEQTHRLLSHCAASSNLISIVVVGTSEVVVDVLKCRWCVFRDEALAKRFSLELDRAYNSSAESSRLIRCLAVLRLA